MNSKILLTIISNSGTPFVSSRNSYPRVNLVLRFYNISGNKPGLNVEYRPGGWPKAHFNIPTIVWPSNCHKDQRITRGKAKFNFDRFQSGKAQDEHGPDVYELFRSCEQYLMLEKTRFPR